MGVNGPSADSATFRNENLWVSKIHARDWSWISPGEVLPGLAESESHPFRPGEDSERLGEGFRARTQFRHRMMDVGCLVTRSVSSA